MVKNITSLLVEATGKTQQECEAINSILNEHFIIGHNNKEKIVADFVAKLGMSIEDADKLYNDCAGVIVKGIINR